MLKIRLQGTKNDIRWFVRLLQRDKRFDVNNVSTFFDNVGTDKYKRVYAEVSRKKLCEEGECKHEKGEKSIFTPDRR